MRQKGTTTEIEQISSPASRGAAGAYIEGEIGALYLLALLTGNRAPGLPDARVVNVRFQGVEQGFELDDLIIKGVGVAGDAILEIQSKRDITFSPGDTVYKDVALQIARSRVSSVPADRHHLGIATQRTSRKISGAYQDVLKWARSAATASEFFGRMAAKGAANQDMRDFVTTTRAHLIAGGVADEVEAIWQRLRRILIIEFDFEGSAPMARAYGLALGRQALAADETDRAEALWSRLVDLSVKTGTTGGEINGQAVKANIVAAGFHLVGERNYSPARARIHEMAQNTLAHIGRSVAGVTLPRLEAVAALDEASDTHRYIEVRGDTGVGKSWVLRHFAERVGRYAQIIVLDRDATPPGGWLVFANALSIPGTAVDFLTDLAASGGAVLFVDGIDMFDDSGRQRTISELMRAASAIPGFAVIATTRTAAGVDGEPWLADDILSALGGVHSIHVGALSDDEVAILIHQSPDLRILLDLNHPAASLARNLYRLSRLLKLPSATEIRTEAALARQWWSSADGATSTEVRAAQRILATLAIGALSGKTEIELIDDSPARSHLVGAQSLREVRRDWLGFYHDVLRDWAIANYIAEDPARLAALDLSVPVSPRIARGIEFAARLMLEAGADCVCWIDLLAHLSPARAHGSWRRQALLAVVRSEAGLELLDNCGARLLAAEAALLVELCTTIAAVETVATADLMASPEGAKLDLPRSFRIDVTGSATILLRWVVAHSKQIPISAISAIAELIKVQLYILKLMRPLAEQTASLLFGWLQQLDVRGAVVTIPCERNLGQATSNARHTAVEKLRFIALLLGEFAPDCVKAYLNAISNERNIYKVNELRPFSKIIAPVAPSELVTLILSSLIETRERPRCRNHDRSIERAFTFADSDYLPASPAQPPFLDLLEAAPAYGLKLIRTLVAEAIEFDTDAREPGDDGFTIEVGGAPRFFAWRNSYMWSRDQSRDYSAASGLKALEAWSHKRLDDGEPVEAVIGDVLGSENSCAAFLLVGVDVLLSHPGMARDALAQFIGDPELLATDRIRQSHDQIGSGINRLTIGNEPTGNVRLADLKARQSRTASLFDILPYYLADDLVGNQLRERLGTAVARLDPYDSHSSLSDTRFIARYANNMLQRSNWIDAGDGKLAYRSPPDEAAHLATMETRRVAFVRSTQIESRISLAIDSGGNHATAATARDAVDYAEGNLPKIDSETDALEPRSTRLITTALLVARDGDDALLALHEDWVRQVIAITLEAQSDRSSGSQDALRFNRPAIATLALIHLWARKKGSGDRNVLVRLATRKDRSAAPAFLDGLDRIVGTEVRLLKAAMRAAFASVTWRWEQYEEEDAGEHERFGAARTAAVDAAVAAEIAWLDGGVEPTWPAWPEERPHLQWNSRIRVLGPVTQAEFADDDAAETVIAESPSRIHVDSRAAAAWLGLIQASPKRSIAWRQDVVDAYSDWTARMNGHGLPVDVEMELNPHEWNSRYYALLAERLLDAPGALFEADLKLVNDLPDKPFGEVAQTVLHSVDALYFNDLQREADRPATLRARLVARVMILNRWKQASDPASTRIDLESGGIIAKLLLNTHSPFNGTQSYLPVALFDRVDPLLSVMRPLLPGGPTAFIALCTMNLLLVAPRARHLHFLLEAAEVWFGRTKEAGLWIGVGIGHMIVQWLEVAIIETPGMLAATHPARERIDWVLGQLVSVGVAEAHDLELRVEAAAEPDLATQAVDRISQSLPALAGGGVASPR